MLSGPYPQKQETLPGPGAAVTLLSREVPCALHDARVQSPLPEVALGAELEGWGPEGLLVVPAEMSVGSQEAGPQVAAALSPRHVAGVDCHSQKDPQVRCSQSWAGPSCQEGKDL